MVKIQPCRNGCKKLIVVQLDDGKYKPFEVDSEGNAIKLHDCPNSDYNRNKQQQGTATTTTTTTTNQPKFTPETTNSPIMPGQTAIDKPSLDQVLLNQVSQAIGSLQSSFQVFVTEFLKRTDQQLEYEKNNNLMLDALVAHFKLTEPTKAINLLNEKKEGEEQQEEEQQQTTNETGLINHAKKADDYIQQQQAGSVV